MQTTSLHFSHASSGQCGWASVVVACAAGASTVLRGLRKSVLAKGIRAALLLAVFLVALLPKTHILYSCRYEFRPDAAMDADPAAPHHAHP